MLLFDWPFTIMSIGHASMIYYQDDGNADPIPIETGSALQSYAVHIALQCPSSH